MFFSTLERKLAQRPSVVSSMLNVGTLDDCNVFVKYLPHDLTDTDFYKMFKGFGTIVSSKIMVDQTTGKSLGYGYVYQCSFQIHVFG